MRVRDSKNQWKIELLLMSRDGRKSCKIIFSFIPLCNIFEQEKKFSENRNGNESNSSNKKMYNQRVFSRLGRKHKCGTEFTQTASSCFMVCSPTWLLHGSSEGRPCRNISEMGKTTSDSTCRSTKTGLLGNLSACTFHSRHSTLSLRMVSID